MLPALKAVLNPGLRPPGYSSIFFDDFNTLSLRNGGFADGVGNWVPYHLYGVYDDTGHAGVQAEWQKNPQQGNFTLAGETPFKVAGGVLTVKGTAATSNDNNYIAPTYKPFSATGSISAFIMTLGTPTIGPVQVGTPVGGVGVTANTYVAQTHAEDNTLTGAGVAGTYRVNQSQTVGSTVLSNSGAWRYTSGAMSSMYSVLFKPPFYIRSRVRYPLSPGAWPALWTNVFGPTIDYGTAKNFEIDFGEWANIYPTFLSTNIHWHDTEGGAFNSSSTETDMGFDPRGQWVDLAVWATLTDVTWYVNRVPIRKVAITGTPAYADVWHFLYINLALGDNDVYPAHYAGTPDPVNFDIAYIEVSVPTGRASAQSWINTHGDGIAQPSVIKPGVTPACGSVNTTAFYDNSGTSTIPTSAIALVDGMVPVSVASNNATWHRRDCYITGAGKAATFRVRVCFNYGTSNALFCQIDVGGAGFAYMHATGTTVTIDGGPASNASIVQVDNHKELVFDWICPGTGDVVIGFGPNSSVVGENIVYLYLEPRPYT